MSYTSEDITKGLKMRRHKDNAIFTVQAHVVDGFRSVRFLCERSRLGVGNKTITVSMSSVLKALNSGSFSILDEMYDIF